MNSMPKLKKTDCFAALDTIESSNETSESSEASIRVRLSFDSFIMDPYIMKELNAMARIAHHGISGIFVDAIFT